MQGCQICEEYLLWVYLEVGGGEVSAVDFFCMEGNVRHGEKAFISGRQKTWPSTFRRKALDIMRRLVDSDTVKHGRKHSLALTDGREPHFYSIVLVSDFSKQEDLQVYRAPLI